MIAVEPFSALGVSVSFFTVLSIILSILAKSIEIWQMG